MTAIVDTSVWARLSLSAPVKAAFQTYINDHRPGTIAICPPVVAEVGFSARSGAEHDQVVKMFAAFPELGTAPTAKLTLEIQNVLWNKGLVRCAGAMDTTIMAYAIANDALILHYDSDFEIAARVLNLKQEWIVPRGTA